MNETRDIIRFCTPLQSLGFFRGLEVKEEGSKRFFWGFVFEGGWVHFMPRDCFERVRMPMEKLSMEFLRI